MVNKRRVLITFVLFFFFVVIGTLAAWFTFLYAPLVTDKKGIVFEVNEGESFQTVLHNLEKQNIIHYSLLFNLLIHVKGYGHQLKAGEYFFAKGTTPAKLLSQIVNGTGLAQYPFTIIAGWNFKQVRELLDRQTKLQHTLQNLTDQQIMAKLGQPNLNPEGQFFPDTYYYTSNSTDLKVLKRAFKMMQDKLNSAWQQRSSNLPYKDLYQALIAASLIEKEARLDTERPTISGVILNRLKKNMLLQIDATVIYGMGPHYAGTIYKKDLSQNTPYNTYVHKGFPPTPIAMPGFTSINAALHPEDNDYLYYVARGDGSHQFSKTLDEHNKAVTTFRRFQHQAFNTELVKSYLLKRLSDLGTSSPQKRGSFWRSPLLRG